MTDTVQHQTRLQRFGLIGESDALKKLAEWIETLAPLPDPILITGERGTGKELLAKATHQLSSQRGGDLVTVDCSSLHFSTVEAALFGYERGAFTGAVNKRIGFIESAQGGTLFLDEIGTLPIDIQFRFLRFLEEGTVTRVGSAKPIKIRTRVIAATNRCVHQEVEHNRFLPDLFDRLHVFPIHIPPLRERGTDVLLLTEYFMDQKISRRFTKEAKETLLHYGFPGNIRELKHLCRRLAVFCRDRRITADDIHRYLCLQAPHQQGKTSL